MECIEARALKSSFLSQTSMKANSQVLFNDDGWCWSGINSGPCDDFPVEDLLNLDFSDKDFQEGLFLNEDGQEKGVQHRNSNSSSTFSGVDDFDNVPSGELSVPIDDLENLEWLSQFVDDSTSGVSLLCPDGSFMEKAGEFSENQIVPVSRPVVQKIRVPCFPLPVPGKARSKRQRPNGKTWSLSSPALSAAESSSTTSSSIGSSTLSPFVLKTPVHDMDWFSYVEKPPAKKQKRKPKAESGSVSGSSQTLRRCTHCLVQKTPQWRTGPLGPKTLCNACGVRYKSGRLFPEYRPACSPTFSQDVHSNSHRKVLEMRRKKEVLGVADTGPTPINPCF
ncbi:GATA transcription factor 5-like [Olea europaea var. sylvestris]|uniref:GATA transcription factor 5-like n=1 Tax=Olea europaea var. sylvestris TaxID=158386 RepID=UPI000C1CF5C3|nr:GATA transcription factor 5-like [Olea europaea var. sylvestris]XP_022853453.1 GATA transcription factor 5-like [Olea europaea var. sylvestris]